MSDNMQRRRAFRRNLGVVILLIAAVSVVFWGIGIAPESSPVEGVFQLKGAAGEGRERTSDVRDLAAHRAGAVHGSVLRPTAGGESVKGRVVQLHAPPVAQFLGLREGMKIRMPSFDEEPMEGILNYVRVTERGVIWLAGDLSEREGTFFWKRSAGEFSGMVMMPSIELALEVRQEREGRPVMSEKRLSEVLCRRYPGSKRVAVKGAPAPATSAFNVPKLYSVSGEVLDVVNSGPQVNMPVLYLDFDGEVVRHPKWNGGKEIIAARPNLNEADIRQIVSEVVADFSPFNLMVTTDASLLVKCKEAGFNGMRCIITPTSDAATGAGGVAMLKSFAGDPDDPEILGAPCWAFNGTDRSEGFDSCAMTISHEIGHTFGLTHDGDFPPAVEYNAGFGSGSFSWGPIMGAPFSKRVVQWSKGEYVRANNQEDDVEIIRSNFSRINKSDEIVGFLPDEDAVGALRISSDQGLINRIGSISSGQDTDTYTIDCRDGDILVTVSPIGLNPNLDVSLELLDDAGSVLASSPEDALDATLNHTVSSRELVSSKKTFRIRVSPSGRGNPRNGGYSKYGSIGAYRMTGYFPAVKLLRPEILDSPTAGKLSCSVNESFSWKPSKVTNSPAVFELSGMDGTEGLPEGCAFDPRSGEIQGVPLISGVYKYLLTARNSVGASVGFSVEIAVRQKMLSESSVEWIEGVFSTYQADFGATNPPNMPISYQISPNPPAGISFDQTTGTLTGTMIGGDSYTGLIKAEGSGLVAQGRLRIVALRTRDIFDSGGALESFTATGWKSDSKEWVSEQGQIERSMMSDETPHGGVSSMRVETTRSGWMTFSWKVDSERGGDFLTFNVNGRRVASISGNRAWQEVNHYLPVGRNVIEWTYEKDQGDQFGRDRGWVDAVAFGKRLTVLSQPVGKVVSEGENLNLTCSVTGDGAVFEWYYRSGNDGNSAERLIKSGAVTTSLNPVTSTLKINNVRPDDSGVYFAKVKSGARTVFSEPARVSVLKKSVVTPLQSVAAVSGGMASFTVNYSGVQDPEFLWTVAGVRVPGALVAPCIGVDSFGLPQVDVLSSSQGSTLRISNVVLPGRLSSASYPVRLEIRSRSGGKSVLQDARLEVRSASAAGRLR